MRPDAPPGLARLPIGWRRGFWLALAALGVLFQGCAGEKHQITPTTLGTDLSRMPRGKMIPFPWPGQSISQATPRPKAPTADPEVAAASAGRPPG